MSMAASRRSRARRPVHSLPRRGIDGGGSDGDSDSSSGDCDAELDSMAGKGIKRLCSELLELRKASEEDFQRNICSNHSTFVRIFKEVGSLESELIELKQHVSTQRKLIQVLSDNSCIVSDHCSGTIEGERDDQDPSSPQSSGIDFRDALEEFDILLSEHQLEEALDLIEAESDALKKLRNEEYDASQDVSLLSAVSEKRRKLAQQFVFVAEQPRVDVPELLKALSGLCRLGNYDQANSLLLRFYRLRLADNVHELECAKPFLHGTYIQDLSKIVFSTLSQAARNFVKLYGETSSYASEFIAWAREETEMFSCKLDKHLRSISEANGGLCLVVVAVKSALSFCSLLTSQKILLQPDLSKFIKPSVEEVLQMHLEHFKRLIITFTATDNWDLDKFMLCGAFRNIPILIMDRGKLEYWLLTSSARNFVVMMQGIINDTSSLDILQIQSSIFKALTELFIEYMIAIKRAIIRREKSLDGHRSTSSAERLLHWISLLVSSTTLIYLFPKIATDVFNDAPARLKHGSSDILDLSSDNEVHSLMMSIQDCAIQLKSYVFQQFVYEIISCREQEHGKYEAYVYSECMPKTVEDLMPSVAFQLIFTSLRHIEGHSKSITSGQSSIIEKLNLELLMAVFDQFSKEQEGYDINYWSDEQKAICHKQFLLDINFLVEIARHGGFCSDYLQRAAQDLIDQAQILFMPVQSKLNSVVPDEESLSIAAKQAIQKLLRADTAAEQLTNECNPFFETEASVSDDEKTFEDDIVESEHFSDTIVHVVEEMTTNQIDAIQSTDEHIISPDLCDSRSDTGSVESESLSKLGTNERRIDDGIGDELMDFSINGVLQTIRRRKSLLNIVCIYTEN